ncbi:MAG: hypothetical protein IJL12_03645, partial [Selenomonadaceae bacterium]|nr:hypothetical protein [Selenomonadaceae bacterium]
LTITTCSWSLTAVEPLADDVNHNTRCDGYNERYQHIRHLLSLWRLGVVRDRHADFTRKYFLNQGGGSFEFPLAKIFSVC